MAQRQLTESYFDQLQASQRRVLDLEHTIAELNEQFAPHAAPQDDVTGSLRQQLDNLKDTEKGLRQQVASLTTQRKTRDKEIVALESERQDDKRLIAELERVHALEKADLAERLKAVSLTSCSRAEQRDIAKRKVIELDEMLEELTARCENRDNEVEALELMLSSEEAKTAELEQKLQASLGRGEVQSVGSAIKTGALAKREGEDLTHLGPAAKRSACAPLDLAAALPHEQKTVDPRPASRSTVTERNTVEGNITPAFPAAAVHPPQPPGVFFKVKFSRGTFSFLANREPGQYVPKGKLPEDMRMHAKGLNEAWEHKLHNKDANWRQELEKGGDWSSPICFSSAVVGGATEWKDVPGRFACKRCVSQGWPCFAWTGKWYRLLPLAPEDSQYPKGVCATWIAGK